MDFAHVLITRFNLPTTGREVAVRESNGWLEQRIDLFANICVPSVARQSEQRFSWIIYLDERSPGWLRQRIDELQALRPFYPCYTGLFDSGGWPRTVREVIGPPVAGQAIITSNLDNDDALASDYLARVRAAAQHHFSAERIALNVPDGYVLAGDRLFAHRHEQNAFTNMVEPDDERLATTMSIRHMELSDHLPVIQCEGPPGWLQLIHDGNVSNRIRGTRIAAPKDPGRFPPGQFDRVASPSVGRMLIDRAIAAPLRAVRDRAFALFRRIVRVDA